MTTFKTLTDKQLESKLNKAYKVDDNEVIDLIESEQRRRYIEWENQFKPKSQPEKVNNLKGSRHLITMVNDDEGNQYEKVMTFNKNGRRSRFYVNGLEVTKKLRSKCIETMCNLEIKRHPSLRKFEKQTSK